MTLDPELKAELEAYGRLCALASIQLGQGAPTRAILDGARGMRKRVDRVISALEATPDMWIQVNPHLSQDTADHIAEAMGGIEAPDYPPEDLSVGDPIDQRRTAMTLILIETTRTVGAALDIARNQYSVSGATASQTGRLGTEVTLPGTTPKETVAAIRAALGDPTAITYR